MDTQKIRQEFLDFFTSKGHALIESAPIYLNDDSTTLFTGSGMQPIIPYLLGKKHPMGKRLVNSQVCLRAQDIDEIGDNRHTTFFEMLGNWSMGDYGKEQQIEWIFEFLAEIVKLDMNKVYISCYIGNKKIGIEKDEEAARKWQQLFKSKGLTHDWVDIGSEKDGYKKGIKKGERIFFYDGNKNWWSRNGNEDSTPIGDPCGPDSEMFYDFGTPHNKEFGENCHVNCDCGRFMEIGNNVFMSYKKVGEGKFEKLKVQNIDHGSGLERIAAAKNNDQDMFKISLIWPIIQKLEDISDKKYASHASSMRVIADHLRAAFILVSEGLSPSNKEQGYVLRRLIRRAIRISFELGIEQNFIDQIIPLLIKLYNFEKLKTDLDQNNIIDILQKEEKVFRSTLRKGLREFEKLKADKITGSDLFRLYDTFGFPVELSVEEAFRRGVNLPDNWRDQFDKEMRMQRERSKTARKGDFKGGLAGDSLQMKKYHTATHLLQSALRKKFGKDLRQHGSNINDDRLRFDFNFSRKITFKEISELEDLVNNWINQSLPVNYETYDVDKALKMGAIGPFGERYEDKVRVYSMGEKENVVSLEICGGPHVHNTSELGDGGKKFKIIKEESSSSGIRRIKAVLT